MPLTPEQIVRKLAEKMPMDSEYGYCSVCYATEETDHSPVCSYANAVKWVRDNPFTDSQPSEPNKEGCGHVCDDCSYQAKQKTIEDQIVTNPAPECEICVEALLPLAWHKGQLVHLSLPFGYYPCQRFKNLIAQLLNAAIGEGKYCKICRDELMPWLGDKVLAHRADCPIRDIANRFRGLLGKP